MPINKALAVAANIRTHSLLHAEKKQHAILNHPNWGMMVSRIVILSAISLQLMPHAFSFLTFTYKSNLNFSFVSLLFHFFFFSFFLSADHGKIIKAVNAESADSSKKVSSVVIEELDVLPTNEPIRNLEIIRTTQYGE